MVTVQVCYRSTLKVPKLDMFLHQRGFTVIQIAIITSNLSNYSDSLFVISFSVNNRELFHLLWPR